MKIAITGSSSGIGRALALRLLARGHHVWGLARSDQGDFIAAHPGAFQARRCDVASWTDVEAAAAEIMRTSGGLDALVTCAGTQGEIGRAVDCNPEAWSATVRTNLDGTFFAIRALWPALLMAERRAKIICFSGGGSTKARPIFSAYGAAKTAVVRLVDTLAEEEKTQNVDINAVAPGAIYTAMTEDVIRRGPDVAGADEYAAALKQRDEATRGMDRALDLVEWLLSPASDGISGRLISAPWDPWPTLADRRIALDSSDIFKLRRIVPEDRGQRWS